MYNVIAVNYFGGIIMKIFSKINTFVLLAVLMLVFSFVGCKDSKNLVELDMWQFTSGVPNNCIEFKHENENAKFQCAVNGGHCFWNGQWVTEMTVSVNDRFTWQPGDEKSDLSYIDAVVMINDEIKGCLVIEISYSTEKDWYAPTVKYSKTFKNAITMEQALDYISQAKK